MEILKERRDRQTFGSLTHHMHKHYSVYRMNYHDRLNMEHYTIYDLNMIREQKRAKLRFLYSVNTHFHSWFQISFQIMLYVIEWLSTKSCVCSLFLPVSLSRALSLDFFSLLLYYTSITTPTSIRFQVVVCLIK